jgi:hypothetical protein
LETELENNRLFHEALEALYDDEQKRVSEEKEKRKGGANYESTS